MGSGFQGSGWNPWKSIIFGFQWVPGPEFRVKKWVPMGSGFRVETQKVGSSGFRVLGRNPKSGFQWVPGSGSEPKKWVPVGSGFRVGTQKVGSSGFRVPGRNPKSGFRWVPGSDQNFFCADPWFQNILENLRSLERIENF